MTPNVSPIQTINSFNQMSTFVEKGSVVLVNITNTLYEPAYTFTDHGWRQYFDKRVKDLQDSGRLAKEQAEKAKSYANAVKNQLTQIPKALPEENTAKIINDLQSQHIPVFGITEKSPASSYNDQFDALTSQHLKILGIDLEKTLSYAQLKPAAPTDDAKLRFGMIFRNKDQPEPKPDIGRAVVATLKRLEKRPEKVVVIDNKETEIKKIQEAVAPLGIAVQGLRYAKSDARKAALDKTLGTIQFLHFQKTRAILSEAQALQLRQQARPEDIEAQLDAHILTAILQQ